MKLAVAATAPFGADVLERLAANHEITSLLTRPDAPRGRGQKTGAPPAKETAERLGIRVLQPARPEPGLDLGSDTIVVAAYGLLIPEDVLEAGGPRSMCTRLCCHAGAARHPWSARSWTATQRPA